MKKLLTGHLNISPALSEKQREEIAFKKKDAKADYDDCFHLSWIMPAALPLDRMRGDLRGESCGRGMVPSGPVLGPADSPWWLGQSTNVISSQELGKDSSQRVWTRVALAQGK